MNDLTRKIVTERKLLRQHKFFPRLDAGLAEGSVYLQPWDHDCRRIPLSPDQIEAAGVLGAKLISEVASLGDVVELGLDFHGLSVGYGAGADTVEYYQRIIQILLRVLNWPDARVYDSNSESRIVRLYSSGTLASYHGGDRTWGYRFLSSEDKFGDGKFFVQWTKPVSPYVGSTERSVQYFTNVRFHDIVMAIPAVETVSLYPYSFRIVVRRGYSWEDDTKPAVLDALMTAFDWPAIVDSTGQQFWPKLPPDSEL